MLSSWAKPDLAVRKRAKPINALKVFSLIEIIG